MNLGFDKESITTKQFLFLLFVAYAFSFFVRMIWVWQFQDNPDFIWNNELMINTNDGYFFASGVQKELLNMHQFNPSIHSVWDYGLVLFTTLFVKFTPFAIETILLYMPAVISSLVVVPMMLITRLYNLTIWGFLAALLGGIAVSYYNRTMIGYYDTDMFSIMMPVFILYFLMKTIQDESLNNAFYSAFAILIYPFFYDQGLSIVYAMSLIYMAYMVVVHKNEMFTYQSIILIAIALMGIEWYLKFGIIVGVYWVFKSYSFSIKQLIIGALIAVVLFLFSANVFSLILGKVMTYIATGTQEEGLHFYSVVQTVREAGQIPFSTFAERISGSQLGVILSLIGYVVLVFRHRAFILALPLVGIGIFALYGGLRFTVYAVPVAALSVVYLFHVVTTQISDKKSIYIFAMTLLTASMIYPNLRHIIDYKVPTVLNKAEVKDLVKLDAMASAKDYTIAWWDYGYPIWYYSETNTLIDGGKHHNDNFIISKIMQTSSADLAANLSRLAVETYVDSNYSEVADTLFKNKQKDQLDPNVFLSELDDPAYPLPEKTRDIYLYLPYRMMSIFPTVAVFGNLDLTTGKEERAFAFYPTQAIGQNQGVLSFSNGIVFDTNKGEIALGQQTKPVKQFIITQSTTEGKVQVQSQTYHADGEYVVMFLKSYGQFIVMDTQTFESMYVQMFMLGKYDERLFELVVSSPYSKIYKLKK